MACGSADRLYDVVRDHLADVLSHLLQMEEESPPDM